MTLKKRCRRPSGSPKDRVFIGVLNRYALKGIQRRVKGIFSPTIFNHAQFFSVWELKQMIRRIMGQVPVAWRTVCQLARKFGENSYKIWNNQKLFNDVHSAPLPAWW